MVSRQVCGPIAERGRCTRATLGRFRALALALLCIVLAAPGSVSADVSFKCKNKFVRVGDSKYEVLTRCGEPEYKEVVSGDAQTKVEEWVYDSRSGRKRILRFHGGRLASIRRLSR